MRPYLGRRDRRLYRLDAAGRPRPPVPRGHRHQRSLAVQECDRAVGSREGSTRRPRRQIKPPRITEKDDSASREAPFFKLLCDPPWLYLPSRSPCGTFLSGRGCTHMTGAPTYATPSGFLGITRADRDADFLVAGIPLDIGTTNRAGARDGPQAIRRASRMLTDGAHPEFWIEPASAEPGRYRRASAARSATFPRACCSSSSRRRASATFWRSAASTASPCRCCARCDAASAARWRWCISTRMSTPGPTISASTSRMARCSITPSRKA